jgi:choline dehydrogenase
MMFLSSKAKFQPCWTGLALSTFLAASSVAKAYRVPRQINPSQLLPKYDYVIVGGGTAGLTVADRLTENPETNVLVLEAGGWGNLDEILTISYLNKTLADVLPMYWPGINSVPQVNLGNATIAVAIGRVVGGGSAVNAMYTMRGSAEDYDRWNQLFALEGQNSVVDWSWEGMLPYFKKVRLILVIPAAGQCLISWLLN